MYGMNKISAKMWTFHILAEISIDFERIIIYISFTITSEALGVYKHAMYITEDGYFWTNAFNGA